MKTILIRFAAAWLSVSSVNGEIVLRDWDNTKPVATNTVARYVEFTAHDGITVMRVPIEPDGAGWRLVPDFPPPSPPMPATFPNGVLTQDVDGNWYLHVPVDGVVLASPASGSPLWDATRIRAEATKTATAYRNQKGRETKAAIEAIIAAVNPGLPANRQIDVKAVKADADERAKADADEHAKTNRTAVVTGNGR